MSKTQNPNNDLSVTGIISSPFTFSHEVEGERFYMADITIRRLSGQADILPMIISERLIDANTDYVGCAAEIVGQFRSYNHHEGDKTHLVLLIFAQEIHVRNKATDFVESNQIILDGFICKEPIYRKTPLGREIADLLLAVNRPYGKSDYLPCIAWGKNARIASALNKGTRVTVKGRVQSREYTKKLSETESEVRIAYEVSICDLAPVEKQEEKES